MGDAPSEGGGGGGALPSTPANDNATPADDTAEKPSGDTPTEPAPAETPAPAAEKRRHKVKDGEREYEVDEDELIAGYRRARAANERFEEAAKLRKETDARDAQLMQFLERLKGDEEAVWAFLERLGHEPRTLAERRLLRQLEREQMSPEQIRLMELEQENQRLKHEHETARQKREREEHESQVAQIVEQLRVEQEKSFPEALAKVGLPNTPLLIEAMMAERIRALESGYDPSPDDLAQAAKEEWEARFSGTLSGLDLDNLMGILGEEKMNALRKRDLERVQKPQNGGAPKPTAPKPPAQRSWKDFDRIVNRLVKG